MTNNTKTKRIVITGHRPQRLGGWYKNYLHERVRNYMTDWFQRVLVKEPHVTLITGMATGTDQWAAQIALDLCIPFQAYIPGPDHGAGWSEWNFNAYKELLSWAQQSQVVSDYIQKVSDVDDPNIEWTTCRITGKKQPVHPRSYGDMMQRRNIAMAADADVCLAVWDGSRSGGTYNMLAHIKEHHRGMPVIAYNPHTDEARRLDKRWASL